MKAYADFDLQIERSGGTCYARVLRSPVGVLPPTELAPPFSQGELQALVPLAKGSRRDRDVKARRPKSAQAAFREAGAKLFRAVFVGELLACWRASMAASSGKVLRLRLHLSDPELAAWPWEYLLEPPPLDRWLAISPDVSIVRYPDLPEALAPFTVTPPLRVLVLVAARTGRRPLAAEREWKHIEEGLSGLRESRQVVLERLESVSLRALREKLRRETWHVLHFIGHGGLDAEGEGALLFEAESGGSEEVTGRNLGTLLLNYPAVRLVVLNSCEGAREGRSDAFSSVAQALVRSRIPAVVAMQVALSDGAAVSFARHFYRELAEGDSLDEVLTQTRHGMFSEGHKVEWGTPVLFLRAESGRIFQIGETQEASASSNPKADDGGVPKLFWRAGLVLVLAGTLVFGVMSVREQDAPPEDGDKGAPASAETHSRCPMPRDLEMALQLIEPESFWMGSGHGDKDERPAHEVTLSNPYCIGFNEVTWRDWDIIGVSGVSKRYPGDHLPATVPYQKALEFIDVLNQREPGARYRLPTEAEWEYANSPGHAAFYSLLNAPEELWETGNCNWKSHNDGFAGPAPVRSFQPNPRGLYDMIGNVYEWVSDWYAPYDQAPVTDPTGPASGDKRIRRGGSWDSKDQSCRPSARSAVKPSTYFQDTGFRIVRDPLPAPPK